MKKYVYNGTSYVPEIPEGELALWKAQNVLGAKNLLKFPYVSASQTVNGITFIVNDDGSVIVSGTATATTFFDLQTIDFGNISMRTYNDTFKNSSYAITDGIDGHGINFYLGYDGSNKKTFIFVLQGTTIDNVTVYPMIRLASDLDDTWMPYAKTNYELTQNINDITNIEGGVTYNTQYINTDAKEDGYYYSVNSSGVFSKVASDSYYCFPVISNIKSGTFYGQNMSGNFTIVQNVETLEYTKLSDYYNNNVYSIPFNFNLYVSHGVNSQVIMFADGTLPTDYIYGKYNIVVADSINLSKFTENNNVFYCGANRAITNICEAIETAQKYHNSILYVDAGDYNLKTHFEQYYGSSYFTNYSYAVNDMGNLKLGNGLHIIFASNALLTCDLSSVNNSDVNQYFSPFNTDVYSDGYTLENMHLITKNCRYAIHDEFNGMPTPYHNRFINCYISHDSSGTTWGAHQAIGGGLGESGDITIDGCYLNAVGYKYAASYHNSAYSGATNYQSRITVKNCYFDNGTFYISNFGQGTKISEAYVSNNSFSAEPTYNYNPSNGNDNARIIKWNNEIRA